MTDDAGVTVTEQDGRLVLRFSGRLDAVRAAPLWQHAMHAAGSTRGSSLTFDLRDVAFCDVGGASFLAAIEVTHGGKAELIGANERVKELLRLARMSIAAPRQQTQRSRTLREFATATLRLLAGSIAFLGEAVVALILLPARHRMMRTQDLLRYADQAGVRALPLLVLLGYLIGLILAFQAAVPMRRFGADVFVANLVALSLFRELGPLLASVILSGRTGSAFAAEIGTMKVNEEIDALTTMGLDPMTMLVLPRMIATMLVMPAMTLVLEIAGLAGMATVMRGFGYPLVTIGNQVQQWVTSSDLFGGLVKALCFGVVVAAIGCRAGLATGVGPRAVGLSATAAVVGGIVATIALDGVFALAYYRLNL